MANQQGSAETLEQHQHEVCNAFARAAAAMRDAAHTAENFSNWFSRVNNIQNIPLPPMFAGGQFNFIPNYGGAQQHMYPAQQPSEEQTGKKRKAAGDQTDGKADGKKKRQPKEKKPKDVNAPKRPPSAYLLFQNEVRKEVQAQHPDLTYAQILGEISKLWHDLSAEAREPYTKATAASKVMYEQAKATYEAGSPTGEAAEAAKPAKTVAAPVADTVVSKAAVTAQPAATSDSSDESTESSSSAEEDGGEGEGEGEEEEEEEEEPEPEPPRKKSKKETVKVPTPPAKVEKKKKEKAGEVKKKKKSES